MISRAALLAKVGSFPRLGLKRAGALREIESAASKIRIQGARYPEALEKRTSL
jgi:hypothetical protein